jgi:precorrin-2/cobalt-factor-2 C20-methyltransferase
MKSGKSLTKLIDSLEEKGLLEDASMVERCGMSGENVYHDLTKVASNTSYFSTIVVREKEKNA